MAFFFSKMMRWVIAAILFFSILQYVLRSKKFTISPKEFRRIAEKHSRDHPSQSLPRIVREFRKNYDPHIVPDNEQVWLTFNAGGVNGKIVLLHASFTEYLALVGTPFATSGHSGYHWINQTCTVLTGTFSRLAEDQTQKDEFGPAENFKQYMFTSSLISTSEDTWLLCYGRGFVPSLGPFFTLDSLTALDPVAPAKLALAYTQALVRETSLCLHETIEYYKSRLMPKSK